MLSLIKGAFWGAYAGAFFAPICFIAFRVINEDLGGILTNPFAFIFATIIYGGWFLAILGSIFGAILGLSLQASRTSRQKDTRRNRK